MRKLKYIFLLAVLLISCGNAAQKVEADTETDAPTEEVFQIAEITLLSGDNMRYDKSKITVREGQQVILTLKHTGTMSKNDMGHNFVLLEERTNIASFAMEAMEFADQGYVPDSDAVIAHTKLIGGGESDKITFDAPPAGTYDFVCTFPGHYGMMKGKFVVEKS